MFDKEIVKEELKSVASTDVDLDKVVDNYKFEDGFYIFRINDDAHLFIENTFVDSCPGYYSILKGDVDGVGQ